jgi:predicted dehydrogenase
MDTGRRDQSVKLVAVSDADAQRLNERADAMERKYSERGLKLDRFQDFREVLDRSDIDAVCVATPNHWHALMSILAIQAGKDVYVEKPVSHNVWEGRQLVHAARKYKKIVQTGTQSRASYGLHQALEFVRSGQIGAIQYAIGTCYKPRKPIGRLEAPLEIPSHIDYDLWCGPAEKRELYRPSLHYDWHWDSNTGNGDLGNQGIHQMDIARWFLGERALSPKVMSIGTRATYKDASDTPHTQLVCHMYEQAPLIFDVRGMPDCKACQTSGDWSARMDHLREMRIGVLIQCEGGYMTIGSYSSGTAYDNHDKRIKSFNGGGEHMDNFVQCIRSRRSADLYADIEEGHVSSALCHTGGISYRLGQAATRGQIAEQARGHHAFQEAFARVAEHLRLNSINLTGDDVTLGPWLEMNPKTERFTNNDAANALLTRQYRAPFIVPDLTV